MPTRAIAGAFASEVRWTLRALGGAPQTIVAGPDAARVHAALAAALDGTVDVLAPPPALAGAGSAEDVVAAAVAVGLILGEGRSQAPSITLVRDGGDLSGRWRRAAALAAVALLLGAVNVALVRTALVRREAALAHATEVLAAAALPGTPVHAARAQLEEAVAARRRLRPAATCRCSRCCAS